MIAVELLFLKLTSGIIGESYLNSLSIVVCVLGKRKDRGLAMDLSYLENIRNIVSFIQEHLIIEQVLIFLEHN